MKRLSPKQKIRLANRSRRAGRKRGRQRRTKWEQQIPTVRRPDTLPAVHGSSAAETIHGVERRVAVRGEAQPVPKIMCIDRNRDGVLEFLAAVRQRADTRIERGPPPRRLRRNRQGIVGNYWDFSKIRLITPAVGLMVAAEFNRITLLTGWHPSAINLHQWDPTVVSTLDQLGFFALLDIKPEERPVLTMDGPRILKFRAAELADDAPGQLIDELEAVAEEVLPGSDIDFGRLFGALMEGVINTREHAYPPNAAFKHAGRWWATGTVDPSSRRVSAIIYDQGVTIPASLPRWRMHEQLASLLERTFDSRLALPDDGATIAAAMKVSRTSTGQENRGKGLAEMEAFLDTCVTGHLRIVSRYGDCRCQAHDAPKHSTHPTPLRGTLVEWDVMV